MVKDPQESGWSTEIVPSESSLSPSCMFGTGAVSIPLLGQVTTELSAPVAEDLHSIWSLHPCDQTHLSMPH